MILKQGSVAWTGPVRRTPAKRCSTATSANPPTRWREAARGDQRARTRALRCVDRPRGRSATSVRTDRFPGGHRDEAPLHALACGPSHALASPVSRPSGSSRRPPARRASKVPGVTDKSVKFGYIFSGTGVASSTFKNADKACQARRRPRQNAEGGVNGRKIEIEVIDDKSSRRQPHRGEGPGREPRRLRRDQQLVVRVPELPLPQGAGVPADRRRLRRHVLRREGQRGHPLRARQLGAVHRPRRTTTSPS